MVAFIPLNELEETIGVVAEEADDDDENSDEAVAAATRASMRSINTDGSIGAMKRDLLFPCR